MNKLEAVVDKVICEAIDSKNKEHTELLKTLADILNECEQVISLSAALGFYEESFDSGVSHKQLCEKYRNLVGEQS